VRSADDRRVSRASLLPSCLGGEVRELIAKAVSQPLAAQVKPGEGRAVLVGLRSCWRSLAALGGPVLGVYAQHRWSRPRESGALAP